MRLDEYLQTPIPEGSRNDSLFKAIMAARVMGWDNGRIENEVCGKARRDGLKEHEITTTLRSAMSRTVMERVEVQQSNRKLNWDSPISDGYVPKMNIPKKGIIKEPSKDWLQTDLANFMSTLFGDDEYVGIVTQSKISDGRTIPDGRGVFTMTCGQIIKMAGEDSQNGILPAAGGAWVRMNPLDGKGVSDKNVVKYQYVLVESDKMSVDEQWEKIVALRVPCATVVHSGSKSLHFAVKVFAKNATDYANKTSELYEILKRNGFDVDVQNKNPSRLSRLPGVLRHGVPQYLVATNIGLESFDEWIRVISAVEKDLPPIRRMSEIAQNPPPLAAEIIDGILRRGHKMLIAGPSKAGKSFLLIQLAAAISCGGLWLGRKCTKGNILYLNMEIDPPSFYKRVIDVTQVVGSDYSGMDIWNLRGYSQGLDKLKTELVKRVKNGQYDAIIIDPIYKTLTGDENSAKDMTDFCNYMDSIAIHAGASVIFISHFSKGFQGGKHAIDRTSGSGVFGRDPDAIITMSELKDVDKVYRMEHILREFPPPKPITLEYTFPVHVITDKYDEVPVAGAMGAAKTSASEIEELFCLTEATAGKVDREKFCDELGISQRTLQRRIKEIPWLRLDNDTIERKPDKSFSESERDED